MKERKIIIVIPTYNEAKTVEPLIKKIDSIKLFNNNWILTKEQSNKILDIIINYFDDFHMKNPYRKGMIKDEILNSLDIEEQFLDSMLNYLLNNKLLKYSNNNWSKFDFYISIDFSFILGRVISHTTHMVTTFVA